MFDVIDYHHALIPVKRNFLRVFSRHLVESINSTNAAVGLLACIAGNLG